MVKLGNPRVLRVTEVQFSTFSLVLRRRDQHLQDMTVEMEIFLRPTFEEQFLIKWGSNENNFSELSVCITD